MYKFWIFTVDTNIKFPEPIYYFKYKGLEIKYITRHNEKKADIIVIRYSKITDDEAYKLLAEYLNALAFQNDSFVHFDSVWSTNVNAKLNEVNYLSDKVRSYDCFNVVQDIFFIASISNEDQSQLISLYRQAKCNENSYFKALFFWHILVYPSQNDNDAVDFINNNIHRTEKLYVDFIINNPVFSHNGKINTSLGEYIKNGARHSIAHIVRDKGISLEQESWEQIRHVATIATILKDIARYKIESIYQVQGFPDMDILARFNPEES